MFVLKSTYKELQLSYDSLKRSLNTAHNEWRAAQNEITGLKWQIERAKPYRVNGKFAKRPDPIVEAAAYAGVNNA